MRLWRHDQAQATEKYNHINKWNTSQVTDMRNLFVNYKEFNDDISEWDVSNVIDMGGIFYEASSFNQDVSGWDVSNVTDMSHMFSQASSFNQDVSGWDVSKVTTMWYMFYCASSFNQDVSGWDVSNVTNMSYMFCHASSFNQDVSGWDVSNVVTMICMFCHASSFHQDVSGWTLSRTCSTQGMIRDTLLYACLQKYCNISRFKEYCIMSCNERRRAFLIALAWHRRESYILFLVGQGYIMVANRSDEVQQKFDFAFCDILFDVEDVSRYVCKFL